MHNVRHTETIDEVSEGPWAIFYESTHIKVMQVNVRRPTLLNKKEIKRLIKKYGECEAIKQISEKLEAKGFKVSIKMLSQVIHNMC